MAHLIAKSQILQSYFLQALEVWLLKLQLTVEARSRSGNNCIIPTGRMDIYFVVGLLQPSTSPLLFIAFVIASGYSNLKSTNS